MLPFVWIYDSSVFCQFFNLANMCITTHHDKIQTLFLFPNHKLKMILPNSNIHVIEYLLIEEGNDLAPNTNGVFVFNE